MENLFFRRWCLATALCWWLGSDDAFLMHPVVSWLGADFLEMKRTLLLVLRLWWFGKTIGCCWLNFADAQQIHPVVAPTKLCKCKMLLKKLDWSLYNAPCCLAWLSWRFAREPCCWLGSADALLMLMLAWLRWCFANATWCWLGSADALLMHPIVGLALLMTR